MKRNAAVAVLLVLSSQVAAQSTFVYSLGPSYSFSPIEACLNDSASASSATEVAQIRVAQNNGHSTCNVNDPCRNPVTLVGVNEAASPITFTIQDVCNGVQYTYPIAKTVNPKQNPSCPCINNPINLAYGTKYQEETDYAGTFGAELKVARFYNSSRDPELVNGFGASWAHTYQRRLRVVTSAPNAPLATPTAFARRPNGQIFSFKQTGGVWQGDADVNAVLVDVLDASSHLVGRRLTIGDGDEVENYDLAGRPTSIQDRSGRTQTLAYSDGTGGANGGFLLDASGNPTTTVIPAGIFIRVTDPFGRSLLFGYDASKRISKLTDPGGGIYRYQYDANDNLTTVTYPDSHVRQYVYNESANTSGASLPHALTGIIDENSARFATYKYDAQGKAISTEHAGGADAATVSYTVDGSGVPVSTTYIDARGTSRTMAFQTPLGAIKPSSNDLPGGSAQAASQTYDTNGNVATKVDFNGNRTNYTYDLARNLETSRTEGLTAGGATTPQTRTISTTWDANFRLPTGVAEPLRITIATYDADGTTCGARGVLCTKTIQATTDTDGAQGFSATQSGAPRVWTYTYNTNGSVLTVNGPRTDVADVTTYTYYANDDADLGKRGNVSSTSNALGQTTSITAYNAHGQPLTIIDANGLTTTMAYDARQRLTSRAVGTEVTSYDYDSVGQLTKVTLPDGSYLSYSYDAAHRLTGLTDNLGNSIAYTLDAMGNRTAEQVRDPANTLVQTRSRVYNSLNRLFQELGAQSQTTEYTYDDQGNVVSVKDPLNHTTANQYDALNRLKQVTDPGTGITQYAYNGLDALTSVTDPRSLVTGYTVDGLGNLSQQVSPDTGTTANTYDAAGNLLTQTDAKGQATTYVYDALNRVALITFNDGSKQQYVYDTGTNGLGRLASITELDPANQQTNQTSYSYDQHGRVINIATVHAGVTYNTGYSYDSSGRLAGMTYPSGRTLTYIFDGLGRVATIHTTFGGQTVPLVANVSYHPFGGVKGYTLGNGQTYARSLDLDGRIVAYSLGPTSFGINYDDASRITAISDLGNVSNFNTYGYDTLDRLTSATTPSVPYAYGYDAVGNRTSKTVSAATDTYTYSPTSNRIATVGARSFAFDANGSTTDDGNNTYAYDTRGRMVQATSSIGATAYQVNALGQRVRKTNSLDDTVFHYDSGGRLIAETTPAGVRKREILYLGDIPVGVVQ